MSDFSRMMEMYIAGGGSPGPLLGPETPTETNPMPGPVQATVVVEIKPAAPAPAAPPPKR